MKICALKSNVGIFKIAKKFRTNVLSALNHAVHQYVKHYSKFIQTSAILKNYTKLSILYIRIKWFLK